MQFLFENWLELTGVISGLLCVGLLIKEHVLTFPIGMLYAFVTVVVVARAMLYADVVLNLYYVLMNAYGWYYWVYGGSHLREAADMAYVDSLTTVASFVAMWMSARKFLSSWVAWFLIDVVQIGLYVVKGMSTDSGLFLYAGLYGVYLLMAVWGWLQWRQRLAP